MARTALHCFGQHIIATCYDRVRPAKPLWWLIQRVVLQSGKPHKQLIGRANNAKGLTLAID